jgi:signal transduction histidine kinase
VHLPILASLLRSAAGEIETGFAAAQRGNPEASIDRAFAGSIAALVSSMDSYLGVLSVSTAGIDARDALAYDRFHEGVVANALAVWAAAQNQLDRLLHRRIHALVGRMQLGLALIGALAALTFVVAALTHRHLVRPLQRLEAVASKVRETKDYGLRAEYASRDEIGRVTAAFNDMLSELAAARARESAERAEFARATRQTAMGEMAGSIAHEVNQPLAAIVASANAGLRWLAHETPDLAKVQTVLQRVVRDGLRASEVVGSVRAMFRKEVREREPIDIDVLIADALAPLYGELQSAQISVQIEMGKGLPSVSADRVQLQQVLVNLIANAADAMGSVRDRARELSIGARLVEADGVVIAVADTGPGIDAGIRERIFDPFFTTKASGMGLGLPICRSIVEAHGGRVWASSGSPHGTVFQLMLPACIADGE